MFSKGKVATRLHIGTKCVTLNACLFARLSARGTDCACEVGHLPEWAKAHFLTGSPSKAILDIV
jgi:hypothetical protein